MDVLKKAVRDEKTQKDVLEVFAKWYQGIGQSGVNHMTLDGCTRTAARLYMLCVRG